MFVRMKTGIYGKSIEKPVAPTVKHFNAILGKNSVFGLICGGTGTGKTTLTLEIIPSFNIKYLILNTCITTNKAHDAIEKYCEDNKIEFVKNYTVEDAKTSTEKIINSKKEIDHVLCIFDDFISMKKNSGNDEFTVYTNTTFSWLRNYNVSALLLTQRYTSISTQIRTNANIRWIFQCDSVHSLRMIAQDCSSTFYEKPYDFKDVYNEYVMKDIHNYMIVKNSPPIIAVVINKDNGDQQYLQIFPEEVVKKPSGGRMCEDYTKVNTGLKKKANLHNIALAFGYPRDAFKISSIEDLRQFIKQKSAEAQQAAGNDASEIKKITGMGMEDINKLLEVNNVKYNSSHLRAAILRYKKTPSKTNLHKIEQLINIMLENKQISRQYLAHKMEKFGLSDLFEITP